MADRRANLSTNLRPVKPKPTELPQQQPIKLSVNTLIDGKFIQAGEPLPVSSDNVPPSLQPFVVTSGDEPEAEEEVRANYELGVTYQMTESGQRGRALSRQLPNSNERPTIEIGSKSNSRPRFGPTSPTPSKTRMLNVSAGRWQKPRHAAKWRDQAHEAAESGGEENYDIST